MKTLTLEQWRTEAERLYGKDMLDWKFKCCNCKETQTLREFISAEVDEPDSKFYYSCIGRWVKDRGCDWTLGGLFQRHETEVISEEGKKVAVFEFADLA